MTPLDLTPVELRNGLWYKREDLYRLPSGVNGAKLRACQHLIGSAHAQGATAVVSAASLLSPQNAMAAVVAKDLGMARTVIVGGSKPATAVTYPSVQVAQAAGAQVEYVPVGYNPYLQKSARDWAAAHPGTYHLNYGITIPPTATAAEVLAFHTVGSNQVQNVPDTVSTLVLPFGSGNTSCGVFVGLAKHRPAGLQRIILMGIGPYRLTWLQDRLASMGVPFPAGVEHIDLHGSGFAAYGDRMPETSDGIVLHPTYEGKVKRYLDQNQPDFWLRRDGSTLLWVVGGPLAAAPPKTPKSRMALKAAALRLAS